VNYGAVVVIESNTISKTITLFDQMLNLIEFETFSQPVREIIRNFMEMGYQPTMEFKPKKDWPQEDGKIANDRYMFACLYKGEWIVSTQEDPNVAVLFVATEISKRYAESSCG
jgi:hypothetical protein